MKSSGYLYVANKTKFIEEAKISAQSLRQFSSLPVALVASESCIDEAVRSFFDIVVTVNELNDYTYLSKIIGLQNTPFERTVFLDSDTFVCANIDELFDLLNLVDLATTQENNRHTHVYHEMIYKDIFPEFNSGVIVYRKNSNIDKLLSDWLEICKDLQIKFDMPGLRVAVLQNFETIKFSILPESYNAHGFKTMLMLYGEIKVIHERLGTSWKTITPYFLPFDKMYNFSRVINKTHFKRLYIPGLGVIPYNYSPANILLKIKRMLGIKKISKNR